MNQVELACLKRRPKLVGKGIYRRVYKTGKFVVKVEKPDSNVRRILERAKKIKDHNLRIHRDLNFVPKFYGAAITAEKRRDRWIPVLITFHEFVRPVSLNSLENLRAIIQLIGRAADRGYVLDIKPSNFGKKRNHIYYLDERGIGKGSLPPDVFEDFSNLLDSLIRLSKKVARPHVRLSKRRLRDI